MADIIQYENKAHEDECAFLRFPIYTAYMQFYGREQGLKEFDMWRAVTCVNTLRIGAKRASEMLLKAEPLIEQEES